MNDVTIKWKKLKKFKAKHYNIIEDKPYTREQIKKLLDAATLRDKCFILLMCSAGLRRGALTHIRLRDITKVDKYGLYRINVYKKEQESYTTFCTPECASYIDQYLDWRQRLGEKLKPNSPLFRIAFDRKFFKTTCIKAGMHPLYSEYVMGHRSGLTKSYFKPTDQELLEGNDKALGYVAAINDLTINEECRLHKKIDEITKKKNEIEIMEIKHNEEIQAMRDQMSQIMSMIQHNPMLAHIKPEALKTKMIE